MGGWEWDQTAWGYEAMKISLFACFVKECLTSSREGERDSKLQGVLSAERLEKPECENLADTYSPFQNYGPGRHVFT